MFTKRASDAGLTDVKIDGAGTGAWHVGNPPDRRATQHAAKRGYDLTPLRARQVTEEDFDAFDLILAMDKSNLQDLRAMAPDGSKANVKLFLDYAKNDQQEVPDPYYGGHDGFEEVLDLVEDASDGLIRSLKG